MKVLFAVNNESISESIIKNYQQKYKEIISAKNVYYFNAIIKELQRDKTYDRVIISEDLEPFSNHNYEAIDKFIFERLDNISDEATNNMGNDIPIILICSDRRTKTEPLLVKLFGIGIYSALIGKDRSITNVCDLLNKPRTKKEAKIYYHIDTEDVDYKAENEGSVSEVEIQNILNHYKRLGRNEEKYVESFDRIAEQYTDAQLRLIIKFLPLNVKAVLEANSPKYQEMITFGAGVKEKTTKATASYTTSEPNKPKKEVKKEASGIELIEKNLSKNKMKDPVIIPSSIGTTKTRVEPQEEKPVVVTPVKQENSAKPAPAQLENPLDDFIDVSFEDEAIEEEHEPVVAPKRRGRPRKVQPVAEIQEVPTESQPKRRGRPKKIQPEIEEEVTPTATVEEPPISQSVPVNLFELGEEEEQASMSSSYQNDMVLPGLEEETENSATQEAENFVLPGLDDEPIQTSSYQQQIPSYQKKAPQNQEVERTQNNNQIGSSLENFLTKDKKVVAFVGTSKNGTSFLVNNLAELLSNKGIKTAILDLTKNKNAYYIYTENEEPLREKAYSAIENLRRGIPEGIQVNKNLTVYTTLPVEDDSINDYHNILETLVKNYSLILLDCDFDTNYGYFKEAQELYLVQTMDVLTIQPLTAFLRELKAKNVLNPEKIRVVLNKMLRVRTVSEKTIIGGMAFYNDPAMSFMTELFNKDTVPYTVRPFEEQTYAKYLEGLINCKITLNGYSKNLLVALSKLGNMVYPLISNNNTNQKNGYSYQPPTANTFSSNMNNTLNKMKNNY
ncbi:MAG: hypothetical protein IJ777_04370 [Clostridia bacterium]|nr:hypothetical protein [Clostridia bacterium]